MAHDANFNPRAPYGARPVAVADLRSMWAISIHAPHTGRDRSYPTMDKDIFVISIHAPHTGRDHGRTVHQPFYKQISIHAPHTGRDLPAEIFTKRKLRFQSTRPIRGATHASRAESLGRNPFQSTRPIRGATPCRGHDLPAQGNFNPRAPYGARRDAAQPWEERYPFQSTRPIRGATTRTRGRRCAWWPISIHAPHTGRDHFPRYPHLYAYPFQSTRPIRGATTTTMVMPLWASYFNPRAPYGARRQS